MPSNTKENGFETLIVDSLVNNNGYEQGDTSEYHKEYAMLLSVLGGGLILFMIFQNFYQEKSGHFTYTHGTTLFPLVSMPVRFRPLVVDEALMV